MRKLLFSLLSCFLILQASAQLNMTLLSNLDYVEDCSDIWGWVGPNGEEYAIVGVYNGVSIVDVTDAVNPVEVAFVPGQNSIWRDIKTWGDFAYATNESGGGVAVIDLSNLPTSVSSYEWTPNIPGLGTLNSIHNIYIDEFGYAYLVGSNLNSGGPLIIDVFTTPGTPVFVAAGPAVYSHDIIVKNNLMYNAEIYQGQFTIADVTDKNNIQVVGSSPTPFSFTHNLWLTDDEMTIFTTDELGDAPVASYDISDHNDIQELDQFRPLATLGQGVIPHNVFQLQDYLVISYYTDGCIVADAARPDNLIEVGNFDTWAGTSGFDGVWGAYPYLPSGNVLVADIGSGLYVFEPNYVRACYLEGTISDCSGSPLVGASVTIQGTLVQETVGANGVYKTGHAVPGSYDVVYSAPGYETQTITMNFVNGVLIEEHIQLVPAGGQVTFTLLGEVQDMSGNALPGAVLEISGSGNNYNFQADANGNFTADCFFEGDYDVLAGKWGYHTKVLTSESINQGSGTFVVQLEPGYRDEFALDLGWTISGDAETGEFELADPEESTYQGNASTPENDILGDIGTRCYVTGNGGGNGGANDVDNGTTRVTSPVFDLTGITNPMVSYRTFFFNEGGNGNPNDALKIYLTDGAQTVLIQEVDNSASSWSPVQELTVADFITPGANMQIIFETEDLQGSGHIVEALFDVFEVMEGEPVNTSVLDIETSFSLSLSPNPFADATVIDFAFEVMPKQAAVKIYDGLGRLVETKTVAGISGQLEIGTALDNGIYMVRLEADGKVSESIKIVKTN